ncbi:MAG TPA: SRPBCC domain-containing protein [Thermoleophilia bacterium]|nr:SRPBCC domain-containing protein [Thermoleophilia bacterium]
MNDDTTPPALATLHTGSSRPAVRFERELSAPPAEVWRALTDPEELKAWFPTEIVTDRWQVGAKLTFVFPDHPEYTTTGTVLELDEPRLLVYSWGEDTLRFELTPMASGGTRLILVDEVAAGVAARNAAGWDLCLDRLAGGSPADDAWRALFARYRTAFEPALGPQEGPPAGFEDRA